jgi:Cytochrome C oxidase, cbb3-type, subunit III
LIGHGESVFYMIISKHCEAFFRNLFEEKGRAFMSHLKYVKAAVLSGMAGIGLLITGCGEGGEGPIVAPPPPPPEYADKHMPAGWWADEKIIEEGRKLFIGATNPDVNCASCHGKDGKPVKAGARDFRVTERMKLYSDSVWIWRISEGVPNTKMKSWKSKLSEEDRWKLVAFEHTFGLKGMEWDVTKQAWVPVGTAGSAAASTPGAPGGAPAGGSRAPAGGAAKSGK